MVPDRRTGDVGRPDGIGCAAVQWLFTGILITASAGIAAFTGYLVRRLFTTLPGREDAPAEQQS